MKKILFAAMALGMTMTSCMNDEFPNATRYGYIDVNVSNDPVIQTRATQTVSADALESWTITAKNTKNDTYDLNNNPKVPTGTYTVTASSHSSVEAANNTEVNDVKWGAPFYTGSTTNVTVAAGQTTEIEINCETAKNSRLKVSFALNETAFPAYSLTTSAKDRNLTFDKKNMGSALAYYTAGTKVSYTLNYTYNEQELNKVGTITLTEAATEYLLSISSNDNGTITITSITYNDEFGKNETNKIEFDAATGEAVITNPTN